jgi:ribosomal 50S subunit-recycling heat shock protein
MRLDKFLKVSRVIKRRTVANEVSANGRVMVNGKVAKPAAAIKEGDIIEIKFGAGISRIKVLSVSEKVKKQESSLMYEIIRDNANITI